MLSLLPRNNFGMSLFDNMDSMFNNSFFGEKRMPQTMKTDIKEEDGLYLLSMDLPGYDKNDIKAELKNGYLTISAEKHENRESNENNGYVVRERYSGSCSRSFFVGDHVTEEDIKAAYSNGTLQLSFPKEAPQQIAQSKYIAIE
ncbi:MAG: Hsp20/alpha crystallin family protein [Firmicutes bacterium]|nr:Hsp20/alpha crystallin family protein [Bacillota bacterium]